MLRFISIFCNQLKAIPNSSIKSSKISETNQSLTNLKNVKNHRTFFESDQKANLCFRQTNQLSGLLNKVLQVEHCKLISSGSDLHSLMLSACQPALDPKLVFVELKKAGINVEITEPRIILRESLDNALDTLNILLQVVENYSFYPISKDLHYIDISSCYPMLDPLKTTDQFKKAGLNVELESIITIKESINSAYTKLEILLQENQCSYKNRCL